MIRIFGLPFQGQKSASLLVNLGEDTIYCFPQSHLFILHFLVLFEFGAEVSSSQGRRGPAPHLSEPVIHFWLIPQKEACRGPNEIFSPCCCPFSAFECGNLMRKLLRSCCFYPQPRGVRGLGSWAAITKLLNRRQSHLWISCYERIKNPIGRVFCHLKPKGVLKVITCTESLRGPGWSDQGNKRVSGYDSHPQGDIHSSLGVGKLFKKGKGRGEIL